MGKAEVWIDVGGLAARFGVSCNTVWRWVRNRSFPLPVRLTKGCTRWRLADVARWEAERCGIQVGPAESVDEPGGRQ